MESGEVQQGARRGTECSAKEQKGWLRLASCLVASYGLGKVGRVCSNYHHLLYDAHLPLISARARSSRVHGPFGGRQHASNNDDRN